MIPVNLPSLMNYKLEKFWNSKLNFVLRLVFKWTINLKSFEIKKPLIISAKNKMNYKLEKFWNKAKVEEEVKNNAMNYKLEKFWNPLNLL